MAHRTAEQLDIQRELVSEYGPPSFIKLEYTREAYGLLWLHWTSKYAPRFSDRNLFLKPDGTRLSWDVIV